MKKLIWTDEMVDTLRNLYPVETNSYTASVLGVSEKSVNKKASELGIGKFAKSSGSNAPNISATIFMTSPSPKSAKTSE